MDASDGRVVLITAPCGDASRQLARTLVSARLAACVNVVPGIRSCYRWEGAICEDSEDLLVVKTTQVCLDRLLEAVRTHHPYTCPEAIALPIVDGLPAYLAWLAGETR